MPGNEEERGARTGSGGFNRRERPRADIFLGECHLLSLKIDSSRMSKLKSNQTGAPVSNRPSGVTSPSQTGRMQSGAPIDGRLQTGAPGKPPCNPGLRQLIAGKRAWSEPLDPVDQARGFLGWHARGYLPHHDAPGLVQFVTFRLHDAMPASRRSEWEAMLQIEENRERRQLLESYLDRGHGDCWLGQPRIARIAVEALRFFDGERYRLDAFVIMPNHVHVLVEIWQTPLASVMHSWKRFIAREANKIMGRTGPFWEREYWDTWMRDETQTQKARRYIENNPAKARLVLDPADWKWGSAAGRSDDRRPA